MWQEDEELGGDVNKTANNVKKCGAITDNGDVSMETNVDEDISTGQPDQDSVISSTPVKAGNPETVEPSSNSMESFNLGDELNLNADNQSNTDVVDEVCFRFCLLYAELFVCGWLLCATIHTFSLLCLRKVFVLNCNKLMFSGCLKLSSFFHSLKICHFGDYIYTLMPNIVNSVNYLIYNKNAAAYRNKIIHSGLCF